MATPVDSFFYLRCIADSEEDADEVIAGVREALPDHLRILSQEIEPYPKFPGSVDIYFEFEVHPDIERLHAELRVRLGSGWNWDNVERLPGGFAASSVWNRRESATFVSASVRWANLEARLLNSS